MAFVLDSDLKDLVTSPALAGNDQLGINTAVWDDTVVVGAVGQSVGADNNVGNVYVFVRSGSTWVQEAALRDLVSVNDGDRFGWAVSIYGDTIVVGANGQENGGDSQAGEAYVFVRSGGVWSLQSSLRSLCVPALSAFDGFGGSVGVWGDRCVVAASTQDGGAGQNTGQAYVFVRSGSVWSLEDELAGSVTSPALAQGDEFGSEVAIWSDTIVVGAHSQDSGGFDNTGNAYVFERSGSVWSQTQSLNGLVSLDENDRMGRGIAIHEDTIAVGAWFKDEGEVFVFKKDGTWSLEGSLSSLLSDMEIGFRFGWSVGVWGDTIVAGAIFEDASGSGKEGNAYVFKRTGSTWALESGLRDASVPALQPNDRLGYVAIWDDKIVAGAPGVDEGALGSIGNVYVYLDTIIVIEEPEGLTWATSDTLGDVDVTDMQVIGFAQVAASGAIIEENGLIDKDAVDGIRVFKYWNSVTKEILYVRE